MPTTIKALIQREQEQLAAKKARRAALKDALADLGRMSKTDAFDRSISVRTDLGKADADIAGAEARIRQLEAEQAEDDRIDALARETIYPGTPEWEAIHALAKETDIRFVE